MIVVENNDTVAHIDLHSSNIHHHEVHADISDSADRLVIDIDTAIAVAEAAVDAVSISERQKSDKFLLIADTLSAVTDSLPRMDHLELHDFGGQRADIAQIVGIAAVLAPETYAQTDHVKLMVGITLNTRSI